MSPIAASLYTLGSALFTIASTCLLPWLDEAFSQAGTVLFVAGSLAFLAAGCADVTVDAQARWDALHPEASSERTRLIVSASVNSPAGQDSAASAPDVCCAQIRASAPTEDLLVSVIYCIGCAFFLLGSIVFLPVLADADLPLGFSGLGIFDIGSACFVVGSLLRLFHWTWPSYNLALGAAARTASSLIVNVLTVLYLVLFVVGSVLFIAGGRVIEGGGDPVLGDSLWIAGSILFFIASSCMLFIETKR